MSKLACKCGYTIVDQADHLPYKAKFIKDQDWLDHKSFAYVIARFIKAILNGDREQWIQNYFLEGYPHDISDSEVIHDIASTFDATYEHNIYQCEKCGRIAIQKSGNIFSFFQPESNDSHGIFETDETTPLRNL